MYEIRYIESETELKKVLELCYSILGQELASNELYCYSAWKERIRKYSRVLLYAKTDDRVIALVLGRPESRESFVCGCVACRPEFRGQGITRRIMELFEENAKALGFKYITLGAAPDAFGFYEKCGYRMIMEIHGQKIFQKFL